ncbi:MAG: DUF427 domain-containing protein [Saprospiraceae bacterium]|nr:DUF427 domain-containing protein [Saprospiraceae bacterium]
METTEKRHYAIIDDYPRKLTLKFQGQTILESTNARILKEVGKSVYNPVFYFPKGDLKTELVKEDGRSTHCPIKGDATYWNFKDQPTEQYFAWSYDEALPKAKKVEGMIAFNMNYLTLVDEPTT